MPEQKRTTETRYLSGWGEVEWPQLRKAAGDLTCAWADYDGFHIGPCPTDVPPYSHIWGWNLDGGVLLRGRLDAGRVVVGWLRTSPGEGDPVDTVTRQIITWNPRNERLKVRFSGDAWPERMQAVEVLGENPVTFVRRWPGGF
jgi:hypothetical protein